MRLTILGSGSPEPYARRASSGYLLEIGEEKLLFDCGGGVVSRLIEAGHSPGDIDYVFFSHLHSDHMLDYARLVHASWEMNGKPIKVFGPRPLCHIHDRLFGKDEALAHDLRARISIRQAKKSGASAEEKCLAHGKSRSYGNRSRFHVETGACDWLCAVPHAEPYLRVWLRIDGKAGSFIYRRRRTLRRAEVACIWRAHAPALRYRPDGQAASPLMEQMTPTPSEISRMAKLAGVKRLLLTHFRVHMDRKHIQDARKVLEQEFGDSGSVVEDLNVFEF